MATHRKVVVDSVLGGGRVNCKTYEVDENGKVLRRLEDVGATIKTNDKFFKGLLNGVKSEQDNK